MSATSPVLIAFSGGALAMGFLAVAAFFLRFWRRTRDGLFLAFCAAFVLLAANQAAAALLQAAREEESRIYLLRLAAFALIILAVLRKNLPRR